MALALCLLPSCLADTGLHHFWGLHPCQVAKQGVLLQVPNSPVLPTALPALLAALTAACQQGGDAALANRLKALLTALTKAKAEAINISPTTGTVAIPEGEAMAALLHRTLYLASRHKDKKVTAAAAVAFSYLLRSSTTAEGG